ncbi:Uncharacterised protein at_DN0262, partial [Pycnogonum litorale]
MVDELLKNMRKLRDDFHATHDAAAKFVQWANDQLEEDLVMEESLPVKWQRQKKHMDGERVTDEATTASDPVNRYRIEAYNPIVDTIVSSIERRFDRSATATSTFYADLTLLHPRNFGQVPSGAMEELHRYLL